MDKTSIWEAAAPALTFPTFGGEAAADVVIVGGGITGVTAAMLLAAAGRSVVVLEARQIGLGTTGHSTGNLYATIDQGLRHVRDKWDEGTAAAVARSRAETVDFLEDVVARYGLACDFARRPHYLFAADREQEEKLADEYDAVRAAGIAAELVDDAPLPLPIRRALHMPGQAQFQPAAFARGLAAAVASDTCRFFEDSRALEIDGDEGVVHTAAGPVRARHIILATHIPVGFYPVQIALGPYRDYGLAARLTNDAYPQGIFWSMEESIHSIRSFTAAGQAYLIVIGEEHKTGQHDDAPHYYEKVEAYARARFPVATVDYRWSAQGYRSPDLLPYVGPTGADNVYVATGFGTNGLTYGPLAARIIADAIAGRENPWAELYRARRVTVAKSARDFLKENLDNAGQYLRGYLSGAEVEQVEGVAPGQGALVEINGDKVALYREEDGGYIALSPICTHLGCVVRWNGAERSWDCPCHGSRFAHDGQVIEGPALQPLERKDIRPEE